jgi:hydrogenase nickel incorporation protein HypA/HybF
MHEFSIAEAIAGQVTRYARPGARVRGVEIVVGALRGLDPEAMQMSWQAVTLGTPLEGAALEIESKAWAISCGTCGREWTSRVPFVTCECGNDAPDPHGTDELDLVALTIEDDDNLEEGPSSEDGAAAGDATRPDADSGPGGDATGRSPGAVAD